MTDALKPFQLRVISEHTELQTKANALRNFLASESFDMLEAEEREDLIIQYGTMRAYSDVLERRIGRWPVPAAEG